MMVLPEKLEKYLVEHSTPESEVLAGLNRETHLKILYPNMLSGSWQGKFLEMISLMIQPSYVLEIGTFTGYSAICLARGLKPGGTLVTIDRNDELAIFAKRYFLKSGYADRIEQLIGEAEEIIPTLPYQWDVVFIDADKREYANMYELLKPKVKSGGYMLVDNVLWYGKVLQDEVPLADMDTMAIKDFNDMIVTDPDVEVVVLPIRDGVSVIRKK